MLRSCSLHCSTDSASQREISLFSSIYGIAFKRTVNAGEFIKHLSYPNLPYLKLHLKEGGKKKTNQSLVFVFKKQIKVLLEIICSKFTAINGGWFYVVVSTL